MKKPRNCNDRGTQENTRAEELMEPQLLVKRNRRNHNDQLKRNSRNHNDRASIPAYYSLDIALALNGPLITPDGYLTRDLRCGYNNYSAGQHANLSHCKNS
ncbi:hypothetical protein RRG08_008068 [Elysia crispata]|uniref:Uncharacterized protein n=1 Tax=Elysia crispata TaxID=231223 RepID=A0AAE0Z8L7_9GAST|nr:hypothetical protein RRG08_008068 [Elysia crispata]